jgi:hypothetical protein
MHNTPTADGRDGSQSESAKERDQHVVTITAGQVQVPRNLRRPAGMQQLHA